MKFRFNISRKIIGIASILLAIGVIGTATLVYAATYAPSQTPIPSGSCSSSFNNGNSECPANPVQQYYFIKESGCRTASYLDADYATATATTRYAQIDDGSPGDGTYTLTLNPTPPTLPSVPWPGYQWTCNAGLTCASGYVNCSGKYATNFCKLQRSNNPTWVNSTCGTNSVYSDCTDTCSCLSNYYRWNGGCEAISNIIADIGSYPWQKNVQIADQLVDGGSGTGGIRADGEIELTSGSAFSADDTVTISYGSFSYVLTAKNGPPARTSCQFDMSSGTISTILNDMLTTIQTAGCTDSNGATPFLTYSFVDGNKLYFIHDAINVNGTISTNPSSISGVNERNLEHGSSWGQLRNNETRIVEQDDTIYTWDANTNVWTLASGGEIGNDLVVGDSSTNTPGTIQVVGGVNSNTSITPTDVFMYDTGKDSDGGKWRLDSTKSWYSETIDNSRENCTVGTDDRCGEKAFPSTAAIVADSSNLYIYNAETQSLWMKFVVSGSNALSQAAYRVYAMDGKIFVGTNVSNSALFIIDFKTDSIKGVYDSSVAQNYQYNGNIAARNSGSGTTTWLSMSNFLVSSAVSDIHGNYINGRPYLALATNIGAMLISLDDYYIANTDAIVATNVWLTSNGRLYASIGTLNELRVYKDVVNKNLADYEKYDENTIPPAVTASSDVINSITVAEDIQPYAEVAFVGHTNGVNQIMFEKEGEKVVFYDEFDNGTAVDTDKWTTNITSTDMSLTSSTQVLNGTHSRSYITAKYTPAVGDVIEIRFQETTAASSPGYPVIGLWASSGSYSHIVAINGNDSLDQSGTPTNIGDVINSANGYQTMRLTITSSSPASGGVYYEIYNQNGLLLSKGTAWNPGINSASLRIGGLPSGVVSYNSAWDYVKITRKQDFAPSGFKRITKDYITEEMHGVTKAMWDGLTDRSGQSNNLTVGSGTITDGSVTIRRPMKDIDDYEYVRINPLHSDFRMYTHADKLSIGGWFSIDDISKRQNLLWTQNNPVNWGFGCIYSNLTLNAGGSSYDTGYDLAAKKLYHLVAVYDGFARKTKMYVNGELVYELAADFGAYSNFATHVSIGSISREGFQFGEVFVSQATLTESQIKRMYQIGSKAMANTGTKAISGTSDDVKTLFYDKTNKTLLIGTGQGFSVIDLTSDTLAQSLSSVAGVNQVDNISHANGKTIMSSSGGFRISSPDINVEEAVYNIQEQVGQLQSTTETNLTSLANLVGEPTKYVYIPMSGLSGYDQSTGYAQFDETEGYYINRNIPFITHYNDGAGRLSRFQLKGGEIYRVTFEAPDIDYNQENCYHSYQPYNETQQTWLSGTAFEQSLVSYGSTSSGRTSSTTASWIISRPYDTWWSIKIDQSNCGSGRITGVEYKRTGKLIIEEIKPFNQVVLQGGTFSGASIGLVSSTGGNYDLAEDFRTNDDSIEAGDVVAVGQWSNADTGYFDENLEEINESIPIVKTTNSKQKDVIGIVSTSPGFLLTSDNKDDTYRSVALAGRVPVKVSDENGPIEVGDLLTPASTPGYAMKLTGDGPIIGKAIEAFDPSADHGDTKTVKAHIEEAKDKFEKQAIALEVRSKQAEQVAVEIKVQQEVKKAQEDPEKVHELEGKIADAVVQAAEAMDIVNTVKDVVTDKKSVEEAVGEIKEGKKEKSESAESAESAGEKIEAIKKVQENDTKVEEVVQLIEEKAKVLSKKAVTVGEAKDKILKTQESIEDGTGRIMVMVMNGWAFGEDGSGDIGELTSKVERLSQLFPETQEICTMEIVYQTDTEGNKVLDGAGNPMPKLNNFGKPLKKRVCTEQIFDPQAVFSIHDPVFNTVSAEKLTVKNIEVEGEIKVQKLSVSGEAIFRGKTSFENQISVSDNTVDVVEVAPGENYIHINFPEPYDKTPFVFAASRVVPTKSFIETINIDELVSSSVPSIDTLDDTILYRLIQKKLFEASDVQYRVINQTEKGFDIILEKPFCVPDELIDEIGNIKSGAVPPGKKIGNILTCHYKLLFTWVALGSANGQSVSQGSEDITLTDEEIYQLLVESLKGRITPSQAQIIEAIEPVELIEIIEEPEPVEEPVELAEEPEVEAAEEPVEEPETEIIEESVESTEEPVEEPTEDSIEESEITTPETPQTPETTETQFITEQ